MGQRWTWLLLFGLLLLVISIVAPGPLAGVDTQNGTADTDEVTVTFVDKNETALGHISGPVADTRDTRLIGLSDTESLGPNEGMVFVYETTDSRSYVMREMAFPLDIIFVNGDGEITAIFEAATDDDRHFTADARWVIEVNRGYAADHGITEGDRVRDLPR